MSVAKNRTPLSLMVEGTKCTAVGAGRLCRQLSPGKVIQEGIWDSQATRCLGMVSKCGEDSVVPKK